MALIQFVAIIIGGWVVSKSQSEVARKIARLLPIFAGIGFAFLVVSGVLRVERIVSSAHRWGAHFWIILIWLSVPFAIGVLLQQNFRDRPATSIAQLFTLLFLLFTVLLISFTGYLIPSDGTPVQEETRVRFNILHLFALPILIAVLLTEWWWYFRPRAANVLGNVRSEVP